MYNQKLFTFIQTADRGSFAKAGQELFISAVSVMKQINSLEEELGLKLFNRTSQGVFLTAAGQSIYDSAKEIIEYSRTAIRKAQKAANIEQYTIRVGTSSLRPCKPLLNLWNSVTGSELFNFEIISFDDTPSSQWTMEKSVGRDIDCFISPCDNYKWLDKFKIKTLGVYNMCLSVSNHHRLARKTRLDMRDLKGETIWLREEGVSPVADKAYKWLSQNRPGVNINRSLPRINLTSFNQRQIDKCFMESCDLWSDIHPAMATIPVNWDIKIPYGIVYSPECSDEMIRFLDKCSESLIHISRELL